MADWSTCSRAATTFLHSLSPSAKTEIIAPASCTLLHGASLMPRQTRRSFLQTLAAAATVTVAGTKSSARVIGASDTIRIAVAGLHGRGASHVDAYAGMRNVQIAYLVDP